MFVTTPSCMRTVGPAHWRQIFMLPVCEILKQPVTIAETEADKNVVCWLLAC